MVKMTTYEIFKLVMTLIGDVDEPLHYEQEEDNIQHLTQLCSVTDFLIEKICEIQKESNEGERFQRFTKCWIEETIEGLKDEIDPEV